MLVISRKPGEQIRIGQDISIRVIACSTAGVRIGIDAPKAVKVHREEVFQQVQAHNAEAASAPADLPLGF